MGAMPLSPKQHLLTALLLGGLLLGACQAPPTPVQVPVTVLVPQTQPVTQVLVQTEIVKVPVTSTPVPTAAAPKTLTICLGQEPSSLAWYKSDLVNGHLLQAIYDGGIDHRDYEYQPVYYKKLPSFGDGDAGRQQVSVREGDTVFDTASGSVVTLTKGVALAQLDGTVKAYDGSGSATAAQTWAQWTLVDGLTWEDGTPVTADDSVFTFQTDSSPDLPSVDKSLIADTASYVAVDAHTTKWTGIPGYSDNNFFLNVWQPLPKHVYGQLSPAAMQLDPTVNRKPLAFGPFKVDEWVAGDHITLSKNPSYWRAGEGLPKLDQLIFRFVPNTNQLVAQLASGQCDLGTHDTDFSSLLPLIRQFQSQKLMTPQIVAGTTFEHLDFDLKPSPGYTGFAAKARNANGTLVFASREVRQALADCLDRQALIDQAANGAGLPQDAYVPAAHPLYGGDANSVHYGFDPNAGLALLAKNGWKDSNGDGVLDNGQGQDFSFVLSTRNNAERQRTTQLIQEQLKANCLIDVKIDLYGSEFFETTRASVLQGFKYDVAEFTWPTGVEPPCDLYLTSQISAAANNWSGYNVIGYSNPKFDDACSSAIGAPDAAQKKDQYAAAQKIWTTDLPSIVLFSRARIDVSGPRVRGVLLDPTQDSELWNVENFDVAR
jgi:peptide/nickel transport system substrate-binding protein